MNDFELIVANTGKIAREINSNLLTYYDMNGEWIIGHYLIGSDMSIMFPRFNIKNVTITKAEYFDASSKWNPMTISNNIKTPNYILLRFVPSNNTSLVGGNSYICRLWGHAEV